MPGDADSTFLYLFPDISKLETILGLPAGFVRALEEQDDWSFVIKSQAVIEGAVAHLLTTRLDKALAQLAVRMPLDGQFSKLSFVEALGALDKPTCALIRRLAKPRNDLVHKPRALFFDIGAYVRGLSASDKRELSKLISATALGTEEHDIVASTQLIVEKEPKGALAIAVVAVLARTLYKIDPKEYDRARAEAKDKGLKYIAGVLLLVLIAAAASGKGLPEGPWSKGDAGGTHEAGDATP